jgi:hypothetical protein
LDPYAWLWAPYHLVQAGREEDLRHLLLNFDYLEAKLAATDPNTLIADCDYLPKDKDLRTVQSVLRHSDGPHFGWPSQDLPGQLLGRLPRNLTPDIDALRSRASEHKGLPYLRPLSPSLTPLAASLIRTLEGYGSRILAVAVTPNGRRVVSGSAENTLRVWDLKDGKEILTFTVDGEVTACNLAQDNRTIVAGDGFGRVHFLRLVKAHETKAFKRQYKNSTATSGLRFHRRT